MKRNTILIGLLLAALILSSSASFGGDAFRWPLPSKTPNTDVPCPNCPASTPTNVLKTIGYQLPITTFVGRYLDSQSTPDHQRQFRTARANTTFFVPSRNRVYMLIGSALVAYDIDKFFSRLASGENMMSAASIAISQNALYCPPCEGVLGFDEYFNADHGGSTWTTPDIDGQDRLFHYDWDDRGNVLLAYSVYGWGIVHDDKATDGSKMQSVFQYLPTLSTDITPFQIVSVKTSDGSYYALVGGAGDATRTDVWDVTNPSNVVPQGKLTRGIVSFAKSADERTIAIVDGFSKVSIFTADNLARGGSPTATFSAPGGVAFSGLASDGTNFFSSYLSQNGGLVFAEFSPSGGVYHEVDIPAPAVPNYLGQTALIRMSVIQLRYNSGYLTLSGVENGAFDVHIFKLSGQTVNFIDVNHYFAKYYYASPSGYTHPDTAYINILDAWVYRQLTHTYLLVAAKGLGDVYEIRGTDGVAASLKRTGETPNPYSVTAPGTKGFYGDKLTFTSTTSAPAPLNVSWNFGNQESVGTNTAIATTGIDVSHQYAGLSQGSLPSNRSVVATNVADSTITDTVNVTVNLPAVHVSALSAPTKLLFTQPNATASATVILFGDQFVDASDGAVESHYIDWNIDGNVTKAIPSAPVAAGACGTHSLIFNAHYGPYSGTGPTLTFTSTDYPIGFNGAYTVEPFVATLDVPVTDPQIPNNILFKSVPRYSSSLPLGAGTPVNYLWEIVTPTGVLSSLSQSGAATITTIPNYSVVKSTFNGTLGYFARLTITVGVDKVPSGCQNYLSSHAASSPLNPPDPKVASSGCTTAGSPCSFTASSATGADTSGWTFVWSVNPATVAGCTSNCTSAFSPLNIPAGTYTITVTATNPIGTASAQSLVTLQAPQCPTMIPDTNVYIAFTGNNSGCVPAAGTCQTNETINFNAQSFNYPFACNTHTFAWNFGDGGTASTQAANHSYAGTGQFTVTCIVNNGSQSVTLTKTVNVGTVQNPPPPPPPPGGCGTMQPGSNIYIAYSAPSNCTPTFGTCATGETIAFTVASFGYSIACAQHSFSWNFDDGGTASTQSATHAYGTARTYNVSVLVSNGSQTVTLTQQVPVGGVVTPPPNGNCLTMVADQNVYIAYTGANSNCTPTFGTCSQNEAISFDIQKFGSYDFACAAHTYSWNFGDGATSTSKAATHTYATPNTYTVTCTVFNGSQTLTLTKPLTVGGTAGCPTMTAGQNVNITYQGNGCSGGTGTCLSGSPVTFTVSPSSGYSFSCATHSFTWDFGDGSDPQTGVSVQHTYSTSKTYNVNVVVTNPSQSVLLSKSVVVGTPVVVALDFSVSVLSGTTYSFTPSAAPAGLVTQWTWDFGDGSPTITVNGSAAVTQFHIYTHPGTYTVKLTALTSQGTATPAIKTIQAGTGRHRSAPH